MARYTVFTRTWWKNNPSWPNGLEPCAGRRTTIGHAETSEAARRIAKDYNDSHNPGRLSRKAEYTSN
jgi:hypothetical protein